MTGAIDLEDLVTGLPTEKAPLRRRAELPVSDHAIRVWCDAMDVDNAVYHDQQAARAAGYRGTVAPPALLQTWCMPVSRAGRAAEPTLHAILRARAGDVGYDHVVATDYEQEYTGSVHAGDLLTEDSWVRSVSAEKATRLGPGRFVEIGLSFATDDGAPVGRMTSRMLYFRSLEGDQPREPRPGRSPAGGPGSAADVQLTRSLIIRSALAANDQEAVHHDIEQARMQGLPDIIASIVTTTGLVHRFIQQQRPEATCRSLRMRLARPAVPGDVLSFRQDPVSPGVVAITADHSRGRHVTATAELTTTPGSEEDRAEHR